MAEPASQVTVCNTWEDWTKLLRESPVLDGCIYRGQASATWTLSSQFEFKWGEILRASGIKHIPVLLDAYEAVARLSRFKALATGLPGICTDDLSAEDWEVLARHHGLESRLLDWTEGPYVASFFAFAECAPLIDCTGLRLGGPGPNVAIWCLNVHKWPDVVKKNLKLIEHRRDSFQRQCAQAAVFTHLTSRDHFDLERYLADCGAPDLLLKVEIPARQIIPALSDLGRMNINYARLFPDLDGAAKQVELEMQLRMANQISKPPRQVT